MIQLHYKPPAALDKEIDDPGPSSNIVCKAQLSKTKIAAVTKQLKQSNTAKHDQVTLQTLKAEGSVIVDYIHIPILYGIEKVGLVQLETSCYCDHAQKEREDTT